MGIATWVSNAIVAPMGSEVASDLVVIGLRGRLGLVIVDSFKHRRRALGA